MQQLAEVTASSASSNQKPKVNIMITDPEKPLVLSPSTTGPYFGSSDESNDAAEKDVADWIARARQSLDHFGSLVGIGGAAMPQRYLIRESYEESDSSDDDEFVDVSEELDDFGNPDDRYEVAVEEPNGDDMGSEGPGDPSLQLRHKSSASSFGTTGTANGSYRKKVPGELSKPASLPVQAAPFGLFGNLMLKNPRSRAGSAERDDEDKGPGIANENFFKPSESLFFWCLLSQSLKQAHV